MPRYVVTVSIRADLEREVTAENEDEAITKTDFYDEATDVIAGGTWGVYRVDDGS